MKALYALAAVLVAFLFTGCTTPSLGRMPPYLDEYDACNDVAKNMGLVNRFQANVAENADYSRGAGIASAVLLGVNTQADELREMQAAWKSGLMRRIGLDGAWQELGCAGDAPAYEGPPPCKSNWANWNLDRGPKNKKVCVGFSRKERERFGIE